ncbi:ABC transporter ATP-binding protein [Corynebacterium minutissimum]|uniref:ABC transporter ATP-binding protein n=1 Tax=uncultured Corynebacterium sp. TaxID=159447 RepID=UPI0025D33787|nr:ABC transporter ATP-binding protein [uncultured Corynebacterium sp.]
MTTPESALRGHDLSLNYGERLVSEHLNVEIPEGKITVIIGPNACGKSTLLRALSRLLTPKHGHVLLDGQDVQRMPAKEFARKLGLLPQQSNAPAGITVGDLAARGRYPHQNLLQQWTEADEAAVEKALRATDLLELVDRPVDELSGGQRQRVWISLLLAQNPPVMLLDEPTTFLDIANQLEVLELCYRLNREEGRTIVLVLHELTQAARFADHLIVMHGGQIVRDGPVQDVLTEDLLQDVFRINSRIIEDPVSGRPLVIPIDSVRTH